MAITLSEQPEPIAFSGNPIVFKLESDVARGVAFSGSVDCSRLLVKGKKILFQFGDQSIEMSQADKPDDSGTQFPIYLHEQILKASDLVPYFTANYGLNKHYIIEAKEDDKILFRARCEGTYSNWKPHADWVIHTLGVDPKNNFKFLFEVYFRHAGEGDFENVYSEELNQDSTFFGTLTLDVSSILDACLSHEEPVMSTSVRLCTASKGEYYCRFSELSGIPPVAGKGFQSEVKQVIKGGFSHIGFKTKKLLQLLQPVPQEASKDSFLKQGPRVRSLRVDQPETLVFINLRENISQLRLKTMVTYTDQSIDAILSPAVTVKKYDKVAFQIGQLPSSSKILQHYRCFLLDQTGSVVSETMTYTLDSEVRDHVRYFLYASSFGTLETLVAFGRGSEEYELAGQTITRPQALHYELYHGNRVSFDLRLQRTFTVSTGWLDKRSFHLLADFFLAEKKWIIQKGVPLPITVTTKKAGEYHDLNPLIAQTFEYRFDFEDDYYTEDEL